MTIVAKMSGPVKKTMSAAPNKSGPKTHTKTPNPPAPRGHDHHGRASKSGVGMSGVDGGKMAGRGKKWK